MNIDYTPNDLNPLLDPTARETIRGLAAWIAASAESNVLDAKAIASGANKILATLREDDDNQEPIRHALPVNGPIYWGCFTVAMPLDSFRGELSTEFFTPPSLDQVQAFAKENGLRYLPHIPWHAMSGMNIETPADMPEGRSYTLMYRMAFMKEPVPETNTPS